MLVDSKEQPLSVESIIIISAADRDEDVTPAAAFAAAIAEMNMENATPFQEGNTFFVVHHVEPRQGFFRVWNADVPENYLENVYTFLQAAHKYGYDVLFTELDNPSVLNLYKAVFKNPPLPNMDYEVDKSDETVMLILQLGEPREI